MKTVKSSDSLRRLSLSRGASVSLGGKSFNSTEDRVSTERKQVAEPVAERPLPQTAPVPSQDNSKLLEKMVELLSRSAPEIKMPDITLPEINFPEQKPAQVVIQPAPKTSWVFKVERDVRGLMTQITATQKTKDA